MNKLVALVLLGLALTAGAQEIPDDAASWVRAVSDVVRTERVVFRKNDTAGTRIGLMIAAPEMLGEAGSLNQRGRQVLELADAYAARGGRKLKVLFPEGTPAPPPDDCSGGGSGMTGGHVYILIRD